MSQLIALTGRMHAGKDTLAEVFIQAGYTRVAFADPLKECVALIADEPVEPYHDPEAKELFGPLGMTRRKSLQLFGTEGVRNIFGPDVWAVRLLRRWVREGRPRWVITDCRFENEAHLVTEQGGVIVEVERPFKVVGHGVVGHASEAGLDPKLVDYRIFNGGSVEELHQAGARLIYQLMEADL